MRFGSVLILFILAAAFLGSEASAAIVRPVKDRVNEAFREVFSRSPTRAENIYWLDRVVTGDKRTYESLRGAMFYHKALGFSVGKDPALQSIVTVNDTQTLANKTISARINSILELDKIKTISGVLPVANGGTGVSSLDDRVDLGTDTTGKYVATITNPDGLLTISGAGSEGSEPTVAVTEDSIDLTSLKDSLTLDAVTLTFTDGTNTLLTLTDAGTTGNLSITGDLTIAGDDLTLATNTSGDILVADGTNYNPVAVSGDASLASSGALTVTNLTCTDCINATEIEDVYLLNSGDTSTGNLTFLKADPAVVFDVATANDTDFWLGTIDDAGGDDDDVFQIGDGTTVGTNPFLTITTAGNVTIAGQLNVGSIPAEANDFDVCGQNDGDIVNCASTIRLKENVLPLTLGLQTALQLQPRTFNWKETGAADLGFIAEEVEQMSPLLVVHDAQGQPESVKYRQMTAVLIKAIQEQQAEINQLRQTIQTIQGH